MRVFWRVLRVLRSCFASCVPNLVKWLCAMLCAVLEESVWHSSRAVSCKDYFHLGINLLVAVTDNPAFRLKTNHSFNKTCNTEKGFYCTILSSKLSWIKVWPLLMLFRTVGRNWKSQRLQFHSRLRDGVQGLDWPSRIEPISLGVRARTSCQPTYKALITLQSYMNIYTNWLTHLPPLTHTFLHLYSLPFSSTHLPSH